MMPGNRLASFAYGVLCLLCVKLDDVEDDFACLLHALEREVLHLAVEVVTAGEDVRTWKSHE